MKTYFKAPEGDLAKGLSGAVVPLPDGVIFRCPCDERTVYIASSIHTISFDDTGFLTLSPSCGYKAKPDMKPPRPQNWCHFFIKRGMVVEMCGDSQCPGGSK